MLLESASVSPEKARLLREERQSSLQEVLKGFGTALKEPLPSHILYPSTSFYVYIYVIFYLAYIIYDLIFTSPSCTSLLTSSPL